MTVSIDAKTLESSTYLDLADARAFVALPAAPGRRGTATAIAVVQTDAALTRVGSTNIRPLALDFALTTLTDIMVTRATSSTGALVPVIVSAISARG
jgi:hypothetical protein